MKRRLAAAGAVLVLAVASVTSFAQTATATAPAKAEPFLRASISSTDDLQKLVNDLGIPVPFLFSSQIEKTFPILGDGGLATDKPLGLLLVGGHMVFAIPPAKGKATPDNIAQSPNAKPIDGQPGTFSVGPSTYKRLADYLLMAQGGPDSVVGLKDDPFANDYKAPGTVALVSLNLAVARASAPDALAGYLNQFKSGMPPIPGTAQVKSALDTFVNSYDRIALAVARDDKDNLHIKHWLIPVSFAGAPAHKFPQPAFPADCFFQTHIVYPNADAAGTLARILAKAPNTLAAQKPELEPKIRDALNRAAKLFAGADAVSIAVEVKDGKPRGYIVNQYTAAPDAAKDFSDLAALIGELGKAEDDTHSVAVSTYTAGPNKVTRATFLTGTKVDACIDLLQSDQTVTIAIAPDDGKYVEAVAALPAKGEISALCTGVLDFGNALTAAQAAHAPLPPQQFAALHTALDGKGITWIAQVNDQGKYLLTDISIPMVAIKEIAKAAMMRRMGPGGPMGPNGGPPMPETIQPVAPQN